MATFWKKYISDALNYWHALDLIFRVVGKKKE
jgi:hypothetical protein